MAEEQGLAGRTWIGQPAIDYGAVPLHIGPSKVCMRQHARGIRVTISSASSTIAPHSIKASTLRVRRYRERRRERLCCSTIEMSKDGIEDAMARGMLKPDYDAPNVLDAWYADHLSDAALEWLMNNKVITREQRNNAVAILQSVSDWLEQMTNEEKTRPNGLYRNKTLSHM